jgi:hypothetical protein
MLVISLSHANIILAVTPLQVPATSPETKEGHDRARDKDEEGVEDVQLLNVSAFSFVFPFSLQDVKLITNR